MKFQEMIDELNSGSGQCFRRDSWCGDRLWLCLRRWQMIKREDLYDPLAAYMKSKGMSAILETAAICLLHIAGSGPVISQYDFSPEDEAADDWVECL